MRHGWARGTGCPIQWVKYAQYKCASVGTFFSWLSLRPKSQSAPNVNALMLVPFLGGYFCAQIVRVRPMQMCWCWCIFWLVVFAPKISECAQCECTNIVAFVGLLFRCPNCQSAQCKCASVGAFLSWLSLRPKFRSAPNLNALMLAPFLGGYFSAQIVRVRPMLMC